MHVYILLKVDELHYRPSSVKIIKLLSVLRLLWKFHNYCCYHYYSCQAYFYYHHRHLLLLLLYFLAKSSVHYRESSVLISYELSDISVPVFTHILWRTAHLLAMFFCLFVFFQFVTQLPQTSSSCWIRQAVWEVLISTRCGPLSGSSPNISTLDPTA